MPSALVTVSDKADLVPFVKSLVEDFGYTIYSSSGTERLLKEHGIAVTSVQAITHNPEAFGGRMKTISFELGSSLLYRRDNPQDVKEASELGILDINLVICNLYPFEKVVKGHGSLEEIIENIDIGGPLLLRASAKNYKFVTTVCDPQDYASVLRHLEQGQGILNLGIQIELALKVWQHVAEYDQLISTTLHARLSNSMHQSFYLTQQSALRYGENPHQKASFFSDNHKNPFGFSVAKILQGKDLSYNNYLDAEAALKIVSEMVWVLPKVHSVVVVKHGTPCGLASSASLEQAFFYAWETDKVSRFGGILCFSGEVTEKIAKALLEVFTEVVIAPQFSMEALSLLVTKKNLRLIQMALKPKSSGERTVKSVWGGFLIQQEDEVITSGFESVTTLKFDESDFELSKFGQVCVKYLKSNAIALVAEQNSTFILAGAGSGQPNRIDSFCALAWPRAQKQFPNLGHENLILVSDAFFPFADMIEECHVRGIAKVVQPGGSIQDRAVIERANELKIKMVFTKMRHFRHG